MKGLFILISLILPLAGFSQALSKQQPLKIGKLVVEKRQTYTFAGKDSVTSIVIDTLVMKDKAVLELLNKKDAAITIGYAVIGKDCVIAGNDGKNNGTNLSLSANFAALKGLHILVPGLDAKMSNRKFDNGNGGKVAVNYLASGVKPQSDDKRGDGYLTVNNRGGGYMTNAQADLPVIYSLMRSGVPGRPLSQLPNGRVYSGGTGRDGKAEIKEVAAIGGQKDDKKPIQ